MTLNAVVSSFDESLNQIATLVAYYKTNRQAYLAADYKEAQIRQNLIDPFFIALGWDVHNSRKIAPQYCPVVMEPSLDMEGQMKAPDYAFRIGQTTKFFTEAKKIGVSIKNDPRPAYQLRSYAWSAKLPLSLLTDFEELSVYDCRFRPANTDKVTAARINYYTCEQYPDHWREIWDVFSYEALLSGAFDDYAQAEKPKRGTSEVDDEFLKEIEQWRDQLARNIALRNPALSIEEMNDAVQRTIDRIVFLRMAEDRGIEDDEQLQRLARQDDIYPGLVELFRKADAKYNSGLFDFTPKGDRLTAGLSIDDKVLRGILNDLYYPQSPYRFNVMPVEILGNVYEQFLGKVIRLTPAHQAKVEEKPEVKKAGGVYYTPSYIVDYIVRNTVGKQVEGKTPRQIADLHVLDMACGSGSFLLGAYDYLLDYYLKWYTEHDPAKHKQAVWQKDASSEWKLTIAEKKRILTTHLFGVDIDRQAVEVTKLSLLLKVLEGESDESLGEQLPLFSERVLPNLDRNIKCGNSLIGPDYFAGHLLPDVDEMRRVNSFDWAGEFPDVMRAGGFDCIIGNPPYGASVTPQSIGYFSTHYEAVNKNYDTYVLFMEKAIELCRSLGKVSMIVPTGWYSGTMFSGIRRFLSCTTDPQIFVNLPYDVFKAWVDTTIFVTSKRPERIPWPRSYPCIVQLRTFPKRHRITDIVEFSTDLRSADTMEWFANGSDEFLTYADSAQTKLLRKVQDNGKPFQDFADIQRGVTPFVLTDEREHKASRPAFNGTVRRYLLERGPNCFIRFDETLAEPKPLRYFEGPRLLLRELISRQFRLQAMRVDEGFITNKSMQSILWREESPDLNYLLGLVNSRLMSWYFLNRSQIAQRDDFPKIVLRETRQLPIRTIDFNDPADKARHDQMVILVQQMLELHKRLQAAHSDQDRQLYQRQINATDKQIDALVYELYGLTEDEIRIVEGSSHKD